jgi:hypothetical protein
MNCHRIWSEFLASGRGFNGMVRNTQQRFAFLR